ncbi:MAG: hypothetical protein WBL55_26095, partial [Xanthobacteraceae bacterium]
MDERPREAEWQAAAKRGTSAKRGAPSARCQRIRRPSPSWRGDVVFLARLIRGFPPLVTRSRNLSKYFWC